MALKPKRTPGKEMYGYSAAVIAAGQAVVYDTQPTGAAVGDGLGDRLPKLKTYSGAPPSSTKFAGIAEDDVVNIDLSLTPRSSIKSTDRVILVDPFLVAETGEFLTDEITGTPAAGDPCYLATGGTFGTSAVNGNPQIGWFKTGKDSDGYASILFTK